MAANRLSKLGSRRGSPVARRANILRRTFRLLLVLLLAYICSFPLVRSEAQNEQPPHTGIAELTGTYLGTWESPLSGSGAATLQVTAEGQNMRAEVFITGSPTGYKGDSLTAKNLKNMGKGVWAVEFKGEHSPLNASGIFKEGTFIGDFAYKRDRGQWLLKEQFAAAAPASGPQSFPLPTDGNAMLDACGQFVNFMDSPSSVKPDELKFGWCLGYLHGTVHALETTQRLMGPSGAFGICVPDGVPIGQLARVIVKGLRDRPEHLHDDLSGMALVILHDAFPCTAPGSGR